MTYLKGKDESKKDRKRCIKSNAVQNKSVGKLY